MIFDICNRFCPVERGKSWLLQSNKEKMDNIDKQLQKLGKATMSHNVMNIRFGSKINCESNYNDTNDTLPINCHLNCIGHASRFILLAQPSLHLVYLDWSSITLVKIW